MSHPCLSHYFSSLFLFFLLSTRPWDPLNDLIQFEKDGCIQTKVRHRTPMVRSGSLISLSNQGQRRDNCKCQVGCPDQNRALKESISPPQPSSMQHPVHRLSCRFFSFCRHRCAASITACTTFVFLFFFMYYLSLWLFIYLTALPLASLSV